jgi:predicted secreted protein
MTNVAPAKDYLLQVENPTGGGAWKTIGGLRGKTRTFNHAGIETTNHGSNGYKEFLDGAGISSMSIAGQGVSTRDPESIHFIENNMIVGALIKLRITDTGVGGRTYTALFHVNSFEDGGAYNEAIAYTLQAESSGEIAIA